MGFLWPAKDKTKIGCEPCRGVHKDRVASICRSQSPFLSKGNHANKRSRLVEGMPWSTHCADVIVNNLSHLTRQTSIKQVLVWFAADINLAADFA